MTQADSVHSTTPTNTSSLTRRNMITCLATAGAAAVLASPANALPEDQDTVPMAPESGPALAAIKRYRDAALAYGRAATEVGDAEDAVDSEVYGFRPIPLVAWRNYSHIGGSEIENAREEFLAAGINPDTIEQEYRAAKKRERDIKQAGRVWDKKVGISQLQKQSEICSREMHVARESMLAAELCSMEEAAALVDIVYTNAVEYEGNEKWEIEVLGKANRFMRGVIASADRSKSATGNG